jgi:uncharacterized protein with HEPN domain
MPPKEALKYILDLESTIAELEEIVKLHENNYDTFSNNFMAVRAVERDLLIIGEAILKLSKVDSSISISHTKHIIGLRNMIVHAYDSIDPTTLWKILIRDIPTLKKEVERVKNG